MEELAREVWTVRAAAHEARVDDLVAAHLARRQAHVKHPVHDFLFGYYSYRPAQLRRWHPGLGVRLLDAPEYDDVPGYDDGAVAPDVVAARRPLVEALHRLLTATAARPAHTGCFGLHEWAMVYRSGDTRHPLPLRLGPAGTDAVVEGHRIACTHFDAYRFFTADARPLNTLSPSSDDRPEFEQPGCLHAGMDLYKHAFRLSPLVPSDLVADCFELARDIRVLDMRASPYDLTGLLDDDGSPFEPVPIETAEGKRTYAEAQRGFAERAAPLRKRLVEACTAVVGCDA